MSEIKTRPATPEFRDGYDRIFADRVRVAVIEAEDCRDRYVRAAICAGRNYEWSKANGRIVEVYPNA